LPRIKNYPLSHEQAISLYHPLLQAIAYNLVRCKQDAEDIVQDTFLKWLSTEQTKIENTKAYLIKAVTNACLNHLNAIKRKKEEYWDSFQMAEFFSKWKESDFGHIDIEGRLQSAFKAIQTKLEPMERAVFLLKEGFNFDYEAIQETVGKKQEHCRQLLSRAKKKLNDETARLKFDMPKTPELYASFKKACDLGHATEFISELKTDLSKAIQKKSEK